MAVVGATLLAGCATSGPKFSEMATSMSAAAKPGTGRIYFYRTAVLGAAVQPEVRLNGEVVGTAVPRGLLPSQHLEGFFVGRVYGELVDPAKGAAEIEDTRYTGPPPAKP